MNRARTALVLAALAATRYMVAVPASAQSTAVVFDAGIEAIGLTNFNSHFSLPFGIRVGAEVPVVELAPGLSLMAGGTAGWWMESLRDMYRFRPEMIPFMLPVGANLVLSWEPTSSFTLGVGALLGFVLEWMPGAPPRLLLYASPGLDARWFFTPNAGMAAHLGWVWVGADPILNGPAVRLGPVFR
jgi:hypothetical protein